MPMMVLGTFQTSIDWHCQIQMKISVFYTTGKNEHQKIACSHVVVKVENNSKDYSLAGLQGINQIWQVVIPFPL